MAFPQRKKASWTRTIMVPSIDSHFVEEIRVSCERGTSIQVHHFMAFRDHTYDANTGNFEHIAPDSMTRAFH
jgi:hypothetical protein